METLDGVPLVPPPAGRFIPAQCYTSAAFYAREMTHVFGTRWIMVADVDDVPGPGSYVTAVVGGAPLIVVRGNDGVIRGFVNACRHRGAALAGGNGTCAKRALTCPYHGWTYDLNGRLMGASERAAFGVAFDAAAYHLQAVRVETWERFVFVCLAASTEPLADCVGPLAERLQQFDLRALAHVATFTDDVNVNWKVLADNLSDDYHVMKVHRTSIHRYIKWGAYQVRIWKDAHWTYTPLTPLGRRLVGAGRGLDEEAAHGAYWGGLFPNWLVNATPDGSICWQRVDPLGMDRTRLVTTLYDRGDLKARWLRGFARRMTRAIVDEDLAIVDGIMASLRARSFAQGPCAGELEARTRHFQVRLMESMAAPLLVAATDDRALGRDLPCLA